MVDGPSKYTSGEHPPTLPISPVEVSPSPRRALTSTVKLPVSLNTVDTPTAVPVPAPTPLSLRNSNLPSASEGVGDENAEDFGVALEMLAKEQTIDLGEGDGAGVPVTWCHRFLGNAGAGLWFLGKCPSRERRHQAASRPSARARTSSARCARPTA